MSFCNYYHQHFSIWRIFHLVKFLFDISEIYLNCHHIRVYLLNSWMLAEFFCNRKHACSLFLYPGSWLMLEWKMTMEMGMDYGFRKTVMLKSLELAMIAWWGICIVVVCAIKCHQFNQGVFALFMILVCNLYDYLYWLCYQPQIININKISL